MVLFAKRGAAPQGTAPLYFNDIPRLLRYAIRRQNPPLQEHSGALL